MNDKICFCGGNDFNLYAAVKFNGENFNIYRCEKCFSAVTEPPPSADLNKQEDFSERLKNIKLWEGFARFSLKLLKKHKKEGKLLDAGANIGIFVKEALKEGFDAKGIDLNEEAVNFGVQNITDKVYLRALNDENEGYDIITMEQVLEHIENPLSFLKEARKKLKKDGLLFLSVPNYKGLYPLLFKNGWYGWWPKEHIRHYSIQGLDFLINAAGFKKEKVYHSSLYYFLNSKDLKNLVKYSIAKLSPYFLKGDKIFYAAKKS